MKLDLKLWETAVCALFCVGHVDVLPLIGEKMSNWKIFQPVSCFVFWKVWPIKHFFVPIKCNNLFLMSVRNWRLTLWFQLEDMFKLIVTPQGNKKVMIQLKDTPTKVYAKGA